VCAEDFQGLSTETEEVAGWFVIDGVELKEEPVYRLLFFVLFVWISMSAGSSHWSEPWPAEQAAKMRKIGWGGRIRTFTVLINSEVSYQLDHAPAVGQNVGNACRAARQWPRECKVYRAADAVRHTEFFKDSTTYGANQLAEDFMGSICGPYNSREANRKSPRLKSNHVNQK
jgi:hypothetical protein